MRPKLQSCRSQYRNAAAGVGRNADTDEELACYAKALGHPARVKIFESSLGRRRASSSGGAARVVDGVSAPQDPQGIGFDSRRDRRPSHSILCRPWSFAPLEGIG
jgi:hypothetical protein